MMRRFLAITITMVLWSGIQVRAQNDRITTRETIGWYNIFATFRLSPQWSIHTEYQWRRSALIRDWQQGLLRLGLNYHVNPRVLLRAGYANAETFAYGEYPINGLGRSFTEHRIYEMAQLSHKEGSLELQHRFMLEQRFVGRYSSPAQTTEDEFPLLNRARYMIRLQHPLKGKTIGNKTPYVAVYDEILIGFGKNVNANVFDQNRLGILLGYRWNDLFRLEGGYLNQILQFGREINDRNVFQFNQGVIINALFNLDVSNNN